ncbi:MAG: tRNA glutamyl-Q(34) synthetase GluQRS [Steroidobacteraceae bacterium]
MPVRTGASPDFVATPNRGLAPPYRGRFAPSPTGLLHNGSLVTALASWLDARAHNGSWLIRMEDLDASRCIPGAADAILSTLAAFGLESDAPVMYQSTRHAAYAAALLHLDAADRCYRCTCSRSDSAGVYGGHCRDLRLQAADAAWRLRLEHGANIRFTDGLQGECSASTAALGDPIIFRRDHLAAYQLAVVVDDAAQGITHVVRGADLLDSTAWQIAIATALSLPVPRYAHVPLVTEPDGSKLAKSRRALPIDLRNIPAALVGALSLLQQHPLKELTTASVRDILGWAVENWRPERLAGIRAVRLRS